MVVARQVRSVGLLHQSIPFLVAALYIMVHFSMFSFIICSCKIKENIVFAHIYFKNKTQTKQYISLLIEIRYFISIIINTHIDYLNNSKFSARHILKATARSLESVSFCIYCYILMINLIKFPIFIKLIKRLNLKPKLLLDK